MVECSATCELSYILGAYNRVDRAMEIKDSRVWGLIPTAGNVWKCQANFPFHALPLSYLWHTIVSAHNDIVHWCISLLLNTNTGILLKPALLTFENKRLHTAKTSSKRTCKYHTQSIPRVTLAHLLNCFVTISHSSEHDAECPNWDQASLINTKTPQNKYSWFKLTLDIDSTYRHRDRHTANMRYGPFPIIHSHNEATFSQAITYKNYTQKHIIGVSFVHGVLSNTSDLIPYVIPLLLSGTGC